MTGMTEPLFPSTMVSRAPILTFRTTQNCGSQRSREQWLNTHPKPCLLKGGPGTFGTHDMYSSPFSGGATKQPVPPRKYSNEGIPSME